jgi:hypothetical protein
VGYKKIIMTDGQLAHLEHHIKHKPDEWAAFTSA